MSGKSGALAHLTDLYHYSDIEDSPVHEENEGESIPTIEDEIEVSSPSPVQPSEDIPLPSSGQPPSVIPPPPTGQPPAELVRKITYLHQKMNEGIDMKASIERRKDFRNPSIYEKLIVFLEIDELGSNYPKEIYNPQEWGPEAYYDELARKQKDEMDKKERERKEKVKVEFVTGTAKRSHGNRPSHQ